MLRSCRRSGFVHGAFYCRFMVFCVASAGQSFNVSSSGKSIQLRCGSDRHCRRCNRITAWVLIVLFLYADQRAEQRTIVLTSRFFGCPPLHAHSFKLDLKDETSSFRVANRHISMKLLLTSAHSFSLGSHILWISYVTNCACNAC